MLDKLFGKKPPTQSQSLNTGNVGQVQVAQAGDDATQSQSGQMATQQQGLTGADVLALLNTLKGAIAAADLPPEPKEEMLDYLKSAQREAGKAEPDKKFVGDNLTRVSATMKTLQETTAAGKTLWQTGTEVFTAISPWVGIAAKVFGL
jgi:truncated hemoglobin YjbI